MLLFIHNRAKAHQRKRGNMAKIIGRVLADDVELFRAEGEDNDVRIACLEYIVERPAIGIMLKQVYTGE